MPRITLPLVGSGTEDDPYRAPLPRYRMVGAPDYDAGTCVVEVPDHDVPAAVQVVGERGMLTPALLATWVEHLHARYPVVDLVK